MVDTEYEQTEQKTKCYCHLIQLLRDTSYLLNQTYIVHWNIMGSKFYSIHKLTEELYKELQEGLDTIAEHIRSLDIKTPMSVEDLNSSMMLPIPDDCFSQDEMLLALATNYNNLAESFTILIDEAQQLNDELTADLAIQRGRVHKKQQWLLKSNIGS